MLPARAWIVEGYLLRVTILVPVVSRFPLSGPDARGFLPREKLNALTLRTESYGD